jgi:hypothetical protein
VLGKVLNAEHDIVKRVGDDGQIAVSLTLEGDRPDAAVDVGKGCGDLVD